jgi:hypothetical protein
VLDDGVAAASTQLLLFHQNGVRDVRTPFPREIIFKIKSARKSRHGIHLRLGRLSSTHTTTCIIFRLQVQLFLLASKSAFSASTAAPLNF